MYIQVIRQRIESLPKDTACEHASYYTTASGTTRIEETFSFEIESEPLSEIENEDVTESFLEIEQGKAKKFVKVDDALRWLKE